MALGPHCKVKTYSICQANLVRFVTAERENGKKTQNSGVMAAGDHTGDARDFYGVLKEIKELTYISTEKPKQIVVLFGCDWYCLEGGGAGLNWKSMINCSGASIFPVCGTRMISISCQPRHRKCFMFQTH